VIPSILFNGNTITFPESLGDLQIRRVRHGDQHVADGGVTETVRLGTWDEMRVTLENFTDAAFFRKLEAWYAWASQGKNFSLALESVSFGINTTLTVAASAGATSLTVASAGSITNGRYYLLRSADLTKSEIVLAGTPSGSVVPVTGSISAGLTYAYAIGDRFRDIFYYPQLVLIDDETPYRENPSLTYTLDFRAREDRG